MGLPDLASHPVVRSLLPYTLGFTGFQAAALSVLLRLPGHCVRIII